MGIPYSRQINAAFEQVTPLVAAGYKVLRTTRDISILLAVIQVLTVLLLFLILLGLIALLYCVNPDLEVRLNNAWYMKDVQLKWTRTGRTSQSRNARSTDHRAHHDTGHYQERNQHQYRIGHHGLGSVEAFYREAMG